MGAEPPEHADGKALAFSLQHLAPGAQGRKYLLVAESEVAAARLVACAAKAHARCALGQDERAAWMHALKQAVSVHVAEEAPAGGGKPGALRSLACCAVCVTLYAQPPPLLATAMARTRRPTRAPLR